MIISENQSCLKKLRQMYMYLLLQALNFIIDTCKGIEELIHDMQESQNRAFVKQ